MLINIFWEFNKERGGGNQFLNTLKRFFIDNNVYEENPRKADVLLVNSKDCLGSASAFGEKTIIHRIDGVFSIYRGEESRSLDIKVYDFAKNFASGIIFQSNWSKNASKNNGMADHINEVVIKNCADNRFFNTNYEKIKRREKLRIITSSWSPNLGKGFRIYDFLDKNLDFNRFEYVFIGRSPIKFKNIIMAGVKNSKELSEELKKSDMFLTASENDTCSNSIVEALSCGVPVLGLKSGGTPEIIEKDSGELFDGERDVLNKISEMENRIRIKGYNVYIDTIERVGKRYCDFIGKTLYAKY